MNSSNTILARQIRDALIEHADSYSKGECELTHSEYFVKEGIPHLVLCLEFYEPYTYQGFKDYLMQLDYVAVMPCYIGFNYGNNEGFCVVDKEYSPLTAKAFLNLPCDGTIGYDHDLS